MENRLVEPQRPVSPRQGVNFVGEIQIKLSFSCTRTFRSFQLARSSCVLEELLQTNIARKKLVQTDNSLHSLDH